MGNVASLVAECADDKLSDDLKWLMTSSDSVFNDVYLSEIFNELGDSFDFKESNQNVDIAENEESSALDSIDSVKINREYQSLIDIFAKIEENNVSAIQESDELSVSKKLLSSSVSTSHRQRQRLLRRMYLVRFSNACCCQLYS